MNQTNQFFVGFADVKELLDTHSSNSAPIYAICTEERETAANNYGIGLLTTFLFVADVQENVCRYARMSLGAVQTMSGAPLGNEAKTIAERADSAFRLVKQVIVEKYGFEVQEANVALPQNYRLLSGGCSFLRYDKNSNGFSLAGQIAAPLSDQAELKTPKLAASGLEC